MMASLVEYCLWTLAGAVTGAGLMAWIRRDAPVPVNAETAGSEASELSRLKEHQRAWEAFAVSSGRLIPVLIRQMESVTQQTERAAMDLMVQIKAVASTATTPGHTDASADLSKIIMAMQFQDITQQKLEHVAQALERWQKHLQALLKGPQDERARQEVAVLEQLEHSYTMEEERRLHAAALPDYQEPVPIEMEKTDEESHSVNLF